MDFYLNDNNVINRLVTEWQTYGKLIIAYDYDSTVFDYHNQGQTYDDVIQLLRQCRELGAYFVLFTACEETQFQTIQEHCIQNDIPLDVINETPDFIPFKGRKIYYNILLDDRAGLSSAYRCLLEACKLVRSKK